MLIRADGGIAGTVGGGCGEADVWRAALDVIDTKSPTIVQVDLTEEMTLQTEAVCGGIMRVFVEPRYPQGADAEPGAAPAGDGFASAVAQAIRERRACALATVVRAHPATGLVRGNRLFVTTTAQVGTLGQYELDATVAASARNALSHADSKPLRIPVGDAAEAGSAEVFVELFTPAPRLLILGAGHIAVPLAKVGSLLEFEVVVLDDRAAFANRVRFPDADQVLAADFGAALRDFPVDPYTYIVLVTRGHQQDVASLRTLIQSNAAYIGMIGSKRRVWTVLKLLNEEGVSPERLLRLHAPIGLDIEAITPSEIAVAIGAELVKVRRGGKAASMSDDTRELYRARFARQEASV
jgi:xanthine dehydrogenase accessory factor